MSNLPSFLFPAVLCAVFILSAFLIWVAKRRRSTARALKEAYETLKLKKLRTETIFGDLPIGLEVYTKEGILAGLNEYACQIFGIVDKNEVIGSAPIWENPVIPQAVKDAFRQQEKVQLECDYDFSIVNQTKFYRTSCGSEKKRINCKGAPVFDSAGRMRSYVFILNDVSREYEQGLQLKESIELARQAIQASGLVHWQYDNRSRLFSSHNDPMNSYNGGGSLTAEEYISTLHPDDIDSISQYIRMMDDGVDFSEETSIRVKTPYDEDWQDCIVNATPFLKDETGKVVLYTGFRRNITSWKKLVSELSAAKERAERSDKLKSAFLANISHEIRTPLNAIIGFSSLLMNTDKKEEMAEYQQIIVTNSDLLLRLVNDVLDLSKIEAGFMDLKLAEFDLAVYFDELCNSVRPLMTTPEVELVCDNPYKHFMVRLDNNRLAQVMLNYATNAIKCTSRGTIRMGYRCQDEGICFYVSDTGIGISEENKPRMYQRFVKLNEFAQGTGLGLVICKVVTENSGGRVGFESEEGVGSTFWSWVPCEYDDPDEGVTERCRTVEVAPVSAMSLPEPEKQPEPVEPGKKKKILVVEDIDSNYFLILMLLRDLDYRLYRAADGLEAVQKVQSESFDLVLMDIKMPRLNGMDATREIRKTNKEIPIVALTAHAFNSDKEMAIAAGCNAYLVKPIDRKALFEVLRKYLSSEE